MKEQKDQIKVADQVLLAVAGLAATEADGVDSLAGGLTHEMITSCDLKSLSRCVRMEIGDGTIALRIAVVLKAGKAIPAASQDIRARVKDAIELMTGFTVTKIDVTVAGVSL